MRPQITVSIGILRSAPCHRAIISVRYQHLDADVFKAYYRSGAASSRSSILSRRTTFRSRRLMIAISLTRAVLHYADRATRPQCTQCSVIQVTTGDRECPRCSTTRQNQNESFRHRRYLDGTIIGFYLFLIGIQMTEEIANGAQSSLEMTQSGRVILPVVSFRSNCIHLPFVLPFLGSRVK